MRVTLRHAIPAAALLALAACKDDGPRPPTTITPLSSTSITGAVGDIVADPLEVRVVDDRGAPLSGVVVTFQVAEGGGSVAPAVDTTNSAGEASTRWRLGTATGAQRVTASVAGVANAASFAAVAVAGAPASVALQGGDNQTASVGSAVGVQPSVLVKDRFGNVVNGTSVFFSVASGGGAVTGAGAVTNTSGVATVGAWTLGATAGNNRLTALVLANGVTGNPITFSATATSGTASAFTAQTSTTIQGTVGGLVTPVPSVRVTDANGNPVAGAAVSFVASNGSTVVNGSKTTNLQGIAAPDGWQLGTTAAAYTLTASAAGAQPIVFTATARAGTAAAMAITAGNNQTATVGRTLPIDPTVRITDAFGNGIVGQEVLFEVTAGGGSAVSRRQLTDGNGVAVVGAWTLGDTPGANALRATATGLAVAGSPAIFSATATPGAPSLMSALAGNSQSATVGTVLAVSPSVVVRDSRGNPVPGVTVTFTPGANSGSVTLGTVITNSAGVATVGSWRLGILSGAQTLTASTFGVPDVTFSALGISGVAARVVPLIDTLLGQYQVTNFTTALPSVRVVDINNNPVANATVTFTLDAVGGTGAALTGATRTTGVDGIATLGTFRLGTLATTHRVRVTVAGLDQAGLEPTFTAEGIALAPSQVIAASLQNQPGIASTSVGSPPIVRVMDQYGNGVAGVSVTFTPAVGSGTVAGALASVTVTTDASGYAGAGSWTLPAGTTVVRSLTATVNAGGIAGSPVTFTATVP